VLALFPDMAGLIPDPTIDLDWSGYEASIQEVLTRNATQHPSRPCILETGPPRREFTYGQIDRASNVIAHHLVKAGIERGDVVMIYSVRNVDLVLSIFGVLKAGATFSVLDPA
jgi:L-2-aminoadipate reductase